MARRQLVALGVGSRAIEWRLERGRLHLLHRGVYAVGHRLVGRLGRYMAAVLVCGPGAALSHRSGGDLWAIRRTARARIDVTAPRQRSPRGGIDAHRGALPPDELATVEGIAVTTVARTLLDLAAVLDAHALERAVAEAEARRLADETGLAALLARYPRRRGIAALRAALGHADDGITRSELEELFLRFADAHGVPRPDMNADVWSGERLVEVDGVWRAARVALELDSHGWHGTRAAFERDRARDRRLQARGWRTVRVTKRQLEREPEAVAADLRALL